MMSSSVRTISRKSLSLLRSSRCSAPKCYFATLKEGNLTTLDVLTDSIFEQTEKVTKGTIKSILETGFEQISKDLANDKTVRIKNFGSFKPRKSKSYNSRNPNTGEIITVPEKNRVSFATSKALGRALNGEA